jgi:hypothetical protein
MRKGSKFLHKSAAAAPLNSFYDDVTTVATNIGSVVNVSTNILDVKIIALDFNTTKYISVLAQELNRGEDSLIKIAADNIGSIRTVGSNIINVNYVGSNISKVNIVADDISGPNYVGIVGTDFLTDGYIKKVGIKILDVEKVSDNIPDIVSVATELNNTNYIQTVGEDLSNTSKQYTIAVGSDLKSDNTIGTVASDLTGDNHIGIIANNMSDVNYFADIYQGPKDTAPDTRNDGTPLQNGDIYQLNSDGYWRSYYNGIWKLNNVAYSDLNTPQNFTATEDQTTFNIAGGFTPGSLFVIRENFVLHQNEYDDSNGQDVVLNSGANDGDNITVYPIKAPEEVKYTNYINKAEDYSANDLDYIFMDTTNAATTITLPGSPDIGCIVHILDSKSNFETNNCTIARNGNTIMGNDTDYVLNVNNIETKCVFTGSDWRIV